MKTDRLMAFTDAVLAIASGGEHVGVRLPLDDRPELLLFGESLGSFGAESAFSGADDIRNRVDGMLLVGPPNRNELWREFVADRDDGSTEILPRYENGTTIRFAREAATDLDQPPTPWAAPRVAYLQHPSDPIVWWSPRLMLSRPDWLREPRGADVSPAIRWYPFVTFWQVTADMAFAVDAPDGHGHRYSADYADGWAELAQPPGWTDADTERLRQLLTQG